jgi:hypothetical protein
MALAGALCHIQHAVTGGFTNKSLRGLVAGHLGQTNYTASKMSYDLRRLRLHGLIQRLPHSTKYLLTPRRDPRRRVLHQTPKPAPAPTPGRRQTTRPIHIRRAINTLEHAVDDYALAARLAA